MKTIVKAIEILAVVSICACEGSSVNPNNNLISSAGTGATIGVSGAGGVTGTNTAPINNGTVMDASIGEAGGGLPATGTGGSVGSEAAGGSAAGGTNGTTAAGMDSGTNDGSASADTTSGNTEPATAAAQGSKDPVIPAVAGECPDWRTGTTTFMGLGGIQLQVGAKAAGPTAPMLFYWHGTGSFSGEFAMMAAPSVGGITSQGGIIVSFQGTSGGGGCTCSGTSIFCKSDFDITDQMVACAVRDYNIDPRRIYTTGCSAGGLFATCMAANRSSYIAAASPNSGGFPIIPEAFNSDHTPALMTVHGGESTDVVGMSFAQGSQIADQAFKSRGGFVINCNHGGGHCGGAVVSAQVWEFFEAHTYGIDPEPWTGGLPGDFPDYCTIF